MTVFIQDNTVCQKVEKLKNLKLYSIVQHDKINTR